MGRGPWLPEKGASSKPQAASSKHEAQAPSFKRQIIFEFQAK